MIDQNDLRQEVIDELRWDTSLDAAPIGVAVSDGAVTLTGHVRSYAEKRAAEKAAKRVRGVKAVANDLEVRLPGSLRRDDADIAAAISHVLEWNVSIPREVTASVEQGWVTLEGEVDWAFQRNAAERAVREVTGVRGVTCLIRLRVRPVPRDIREQIQRTFQRSAQLDAEHIDVTVADGIVTLTGTVRSWSERLEAEHAARAAAGVRSVDNRLQVSSFAAAPASS
ncbi:MAG TPA: BON domain-containing protein [Longimicrobiales bacterium]